MSTAVLLVFMVMPLLALALIVALVVLAVRLNARSGARSAQLTGPGQLHARVFRPEEGYALASQYDAAQYGRLTVTPEQLLWDPQQGAPWATPIRAITVLRTTGVLAGSDPHLDIDIAGSGRWRLVVSTRSINRFVSNDFKRFGQASQARDLADQLVRSGARHA